MAIPNKTGSSQALFLLSDTSFNDNLNGNSSFWLTNNKVEEIDNVKPSQFLIPGSTPSFNKKSVYHPNISTFFSHLNEGLRKKHVVLNRLTNGLEKMGVVKYERKRVFNIGIQKTKYIKILEKTK